MEPMPKLDRAAYVAGMREQLEAMLGRVADAINDARAWRSPWRGAKRAAAEALLNYVGDRRGMIRYREFAEKGWQIGSGPTEACCKTLRQRLKGSGLRWDADNAEALMALESLRQSDLWKKYWATRLPQTT